MIVNPENLRAKCKSKNRPQPLIIYIPTRFPLCSFIVLLVFPAEKLLEKIRRLLTPGGRARADAVSYTHLTLPTILLV